MSKENGKSKLYKTEQKEEPKTAPPPPMMRFEFDEKEPGILIITMELAKSPPALARGYLLAMDDLVCQWYAEMMAEKRKSRILQPGMMAGAKQGFKNFISRK